jgi:glycosyltransferase involved in cell wall biosynthesis
MNSIRKKNIIFVSISSDLYGSSKLLLALILQIKNNSNEFNPIVCMPYEEGPLKQRLIEEQVEVIEMPVLKLTRSMLKGLKFGKFLKEYKKGKSILESKLKGREIYCLQSNTLATLFGSFYCFNKDIFHILHIHEIMDSPKYVRYFFALILLFFTDKIIYNSTATEVFYNKTLPALNKKAVKIFNGIDRKRAFLKLSEREKLRKELYNIDTNTVAIGLVGRFNRLKGQPLLLDAFKEVLIQHKNCHLVLVGSPPDGQEHFLDNIKNKIKEYNLKSNVSILPFQEDVYKIIDTLDIVVVPSIEPESFGIIAVEAMLSKKPVIATNIGGLADIIDNNKTGILFNEPYKSELVKSLIRLIEAPELMQTLSENAESSALNKFASVTMYNKFLKLYSESS